MARRTPNGRFPANIYVDLQNPADLLSKLRRESQHHPPRSRCVQRRWLGDMGFPMRERPRHRGSGSAVAGPTVAARPSSEFNGSRVVFFQCGTKARVRALSLMSVDVGKGWGTWKKSCVIASMRPPAYGPHKRSQVRPSRWRCSIWRSVGSRSRTMASERPAQPRGWPISLFQPKRQGRERNKAPFELMGADVTRTTVAGATRFAVHCAHVRHLLP